MSRFVRQSKVRHVYAQQPKDEFIYKGFRLSTATGDHAYIKANAKYMAIPVAQANGSLAVLDQNMEDRRLEGLLPCLDGHRGPVLDFDFNPLQQQLIASGGDDCMTKIWGIPPDGLKESISESLAELVGHDKKVTCVLHHPTVPFVLATGSADKTVKIWDVEKQQQMFSTDHEELLMGIDWDKYGECLASTARDKQLRLIDPRTGEARTTVEAHDGLRTVKVCFTPGKGPSGESLCTVGFTKQSKRQFRLWDQRKMDKFYAQENIDQAAGAILPFFDEETQILFLAGKGDANIRYYELVDDAPWQFYIEDFRTKEPCRGMCTVPRRCMDTSLPEITRMLKLTADKIIPLSFICPRKSDLFQADLYPDTPSGNPAGGITADKFFNGAKGTFDLVSMDPRNKGKSSTAATAAAAAGAGGMQAAKKKGVAELTKELAEANAKIAKYEELLKKNNIKF